MPDVYTGIDIVKEATDIPSIAMIHTLVVEAPEHTEVSGYCIQGLPSIRQPLLIGFKVITVDLREGYRWGTEEDRIGMEGILIQAGRSVAAILL
jgi:hypothetical protein